MKRSILLTAGAVALLSLGACKANVRASHDDNNNNNDNDGVLRVISRLDCPQRQGELTRVSASTDGKTCVYQGKKAEVTLTLAAVTGGDASPILTPIETQLKALMPERKPKPVVQTNGDKADGNVRIDLPGFHINANGHGDAHVEIGGMKVDADDDGNAEVRIDKTVEGTPHNVVVDASDGDAEIRDSGNGDGIRGSYILATEKPGPSGYRVVGYEARGPESGPIVVAVVKSKADDNDDSDAFDDMQDLVERNVGD